MFRIHSSNRVESLTQRLAQLLHQPLEDPLQPEVILVHSHGLERWLSLELASSLGVCANVEFPFPVPYLTQVMVANTPGWNADRASLLDPEALVWALMDILPPLAEEAGAEPLARFLEKKTSAPDVRLYQLSQRLAQLFDRYQLYRPHLLQRWISGRVLEEESWQALIWQALIRRTGPWHRLALKESFQRHLKQAPKPVDLAGLPPRLFVFGLSSLAPYFVDVLATVASHTELHLFFLNPCQEYWGDILSRKQRTRLSRRQRRGSSSEKEPDPWDQLELGLSAEPDFENELLAYFGKMGRDFFDLLVDVDTADHDEIHDPPAGKTALAALQTDIFHLQEGIGTIDEEAEAANPSLQVHSCHSPLREIEVLNDILLDLFERDPGLTPRDVVVMAPHIEDYTSKIHAVFGRPTTDDRFIPYDIADRTPRLSHTLSSAVLRLLSLAESRWEMSEVFGVMESVPVMRRFGITEAALDKLRYWMAESGVRWARDGASKAHMDLPQTEQNTWEFGLERLVLGTAMPLDNKAVFRGILPFDHVEGSDLEILNQFLTLWDQLAELGRQLGERHSPSHWAQLLRQMIHQFFVDEADYERELNFLFETLDELEAATSIAGFEGALSLPVIRAWLESRLDESRSAGGFFTGGVTFCNLLPMRSIPFRVVIMLGMGAREFPRQDHQFAFDLMREKPVRGDRTRKIEDRYMFLEALLAARDHFIVLYTGQSLKDNSEMSPSIFVTQLRDYLQRVYQWPLDAYGIAHRLQPFSSVYFKPASSFRTFAREYLEAPPDGGFEEPLTIIGDHEAHEVGTAFGSPQKTVSIEELIRFLQHPVATYYQAKFDLFQPRSQEETADVEPVGLSALDSWHLDQWILTLVEAELPTPEIGALLKGSGLLPHGAHRESEATHLLRGVQKFREQMDKFLGGPALDPVPVDLEVGDWRLQGKLEGVREAGLRRVRFGRIRPQERYRLWIEHLILQSLGSQPKRKSAILGRGTQVVALQEFNTSHAALHELRQLVELRAKGLQRPLPLFPRSSLAFALHRRNRRPPGECKSKAYEEWRGRKPKSIAEESDYYHQLAFRQVKDPLDSEFSELSEKTIRPMLDCELRNPGW